eukprot:scaffold505161_cov19-Prasinocladus_malaysianus.AAC.1
MKEKFNTAWQHTQPSYRRQSHKASWQHHLTSKALNHDVAANYADNTQCSIHVADSNRVMNNALSLHLASLSM